jgi:O-antigen/teichoic acid export membrane protein
MYWWPMLKYNDLVKHLLAKLTTSRGLRDALIMMTGNMGSTAISAVALILFSRSLGPDDFGVFSTAFSLTLLLTRVSDFGMNQALQRLIAQADTRDHSGQYVQAVIMSRLIIILGLAVGGSLTSPWLARDVFHLADASLMYASFLLAGITILFDLFAATFQAYHRFIATTLLAFAQAFLKLLGAWYMAVVGISSPLIALIIYLTAPLIGVVAGIISFRPQLNRPVKAVVSDVALVWQTGKFMSLAILSAAVAEHVDVLIMKATLTSFETGQFSAAARIAMFMNLIGMSLGTVLSVRVAKYRHKQHLDKYLKKAVLISAASLVLTLLAIPFGALAIRFTVGEAYLVALPALTLLLIATAIANATSPFVALFYVFPKAQYYSYAGILLMVSLIASDLWLIPSLTLVGAGYARIISRTLVFVFTLGYAVYAYRSFYKKSE